MSITPISEYHKRAVLSAKRTLEFILSHPEGVTEKDFKTANIPMAGINRLQRHKLIRGFQVREPERGTRCYHWVWKSQ